MGGLDARFMISRLKPPNVRVLSLTTVATPHRGVSIYFFESRLHYDSSLEDIRFVPRATYIPKNTLKIKWYILKEVLILQWSQSSFADYVLDRIGPSRLPKIFAALKALRIETGAFSQLTQEYMRENFNPKTQDRDGVQYFSYGAATATLPLWYVKLFANVCLHYLRDTAGHISSK